jgi:hypothetical protein
VSTIDLTSDSEEYYIDYVEQNGQQIRTKRPLNYTITNTKFQTPAVLNTSEGSLKASEDRPKNRRKPNPHPKFTDRRFSKHIDDETKWFEGIQNRQDELAKLTTQQVECIRSIESLHVDLSMETAGLSANPLSKISCRQIGKRVETLDEKLQEKTAELRLITILAAKEGVLIKTELASWHAKEQKVTEQIEKSR